MSARAQGGWDGDRASGGAHGPGIRIVSGRTGALAGRLRTRAGAGEAADLPPGGGCSRGGAKAGRGDESPLRYLCSVETFERARAGRAAHGEAAPEAPRGRPRWGRLWPLPTLVLLGLSLAFAALAQERLDAEAGRSFVATLAERAAVALRRGNGPPEAREARMGRLLRSAFAIDYIARLALGRHWKGLSGPEQAAFVQVFGEFVLRNYAMRLGGFTSEQLEVLSARPRGRRDVLVNTRVHQEGGPAIRLAWRLRLLDGSPKIVDVVVEGVSMVLNQRKEFDAVLARSGMPGLMEMLRARSTPIPVQGPAGEAGQAAGAGSTAGKAG